MYVKSPDDLETEISPEISRKRDRGYPLANIIFEDTRRAVLYQNKEAVFTADLRRPQELADLSAPEHLARLRRENPSRFPK